MSNTRPINQIQEQIRRAAAYSTVTVSQSGEYIGGLIIDKPLTLQGRNGLTVIARAASPVVLITSPDVVLSNLFIETIQDDPTLPALLFLEGCQPVCKQVVCIPNEEAIMSQRNLITLGTLIAGETIRLPFEFSRDYPFDRPLMSQMPNYIKPVTMRTENRHQQRILWLDITAPREEGYLLDKLVMTNDQGAQDEFVITGYVTTEKITSAKLALKGRQNNREKRIAWFPHGTMELSERQLRLILEDDFIAEGRWGNIVTHQGGAHLWTPDQYGKALDYDGRPVPVLTRRRIESDKQIQLSETNGGTLDVVEQLKAPRLEIEPTMLEFDNVVDMQQKKILRLKKNQRIALRGTKFEIHALVPWLRPSGNMIQVGNDVAELEIDLDEAAALKMTLDTYHVEPAALAIVEGKEVYFVAAMLELRLADYDVRLVPDVLDFMTVVDGQTLYAGELPDISMTFVIQNRGRQSITLEVATKQDWIGISENIGTPIASMGSLTAGVRLSGERANRHLQPGSITLADMITLRVRETGEVIPLGMTLQLEPERLPNIIIEQRGRTDYSFNLDRLRQHGVRSEQKQINRREFNGQQVVLRNRGGKDGDYRISSSLPMAIWTGAVQDTSPRHEFSGRLNSGDTVTVFLGVTRQTFQQFTTPGQTELNIAVETAMDGGNFRQSDMLVLNIDLGNFVPAAALSSSGLTLEPIIRKQPFHHVETVELTNTGTDTLQGAIRVMPEYVDYIQVRPAESFELLAGDKMMLAIETREGFTSMPANQYIAQQMIAVERIDLRDGVVVQPLATWGMEWEIVSDNPKPVLQRPMLVYPLIEVARTEQGLQDVSAQPTASVCELVVGNYGYGDWVFTLDIQVPWLESPLSSSGGKRLSLPPQKLLRLPLMFDARKAPHIGIIREEHAVVLKGETEQQINVPAYVHLVEARPKISIYPDNPIDFGPITSGQIPIHKVSFQLINEGKADWVPNNVGLSTRNRDLRLENEQLPRLRAGDHTQAWVIWNNLDGYRTAEKVSDVTERQLEIHIIDANGANVIVNLSYRICPADVIMTPTRLSVSRQNRDALRSIPDADNRFERLAKRDQGANVSSTNPQQPARFTISNRGLAPFIVQRIRDIDGVIVGNLQLPEGVTMLPDVTQPIAIDPGSTQDFEIMVNPDMRIEAPSSNILLFSDFDGTGTRQRIEIQWV